MRKQVRVGSIFVLVAALMCGSLLPMTVKAGESQTIIDDSSYEEKINNNLWNSPEGDVLTEDGKLVFPAESTADTRLISKNAVKRYDVIPTMFEAEYSMKAVAIPEGQEFIFACGLSRIESLSGEDGNVELFFRDQGGIVAGLRVYQDTEAVELAPAKAIGVSAGGACKVSVSLSTKQQYTVKVNGQTLYAGELPTTGEGRVGFLQTGGCRVEISQVRITMYTYDTPENPYVEEHFDDGTFDCSKISTQMIFNTTYYPFDVGVQDYNGESVLMFDNAGLSVLATKYQYSNFELTFDVPYFQRVDETDEEGNVIKPMTGWFAITYGDEAEEQVGHGYSNSADCILFDRYSVLKSLIREKETIVRANLANTQYAYFAPDETRGFSVLVRMKDGHIDVGIKWMDEENFSIVSSYDLDTHATPTGYIHIWACETANWAMDNLVIRNLDLNANIIETEYKNAKITVPEDYKFQRAEKEYRDTEADKGLALWYLFIPGSVVVAGGMIAVSILIRRRKTRKEV